MNTLAAAALVLVSVDAPPGSGLPEMVARFQGDSAPAVRATFAGGSPTTVEVEWFLDGDGLVAPVAREVLDVTTSADAALTTVAIPVKLPEVDKPTVFRGALRAGAKSDGFRPLGDIRLMLFPKDHFVADWKRVAAAKLPITLSGPLRGLRELLERHGIRFREGHPHQPETVDRNGVLVIERNDTTPGLPWPGQARAMLVYAGTSAGLRLFGEAKEGDNLLWIGGPPPMAFTDDPLSQQMLLQLLEPLLKKSTP